MGIPVASREQRCIKLVEKPNAPRHGRAMYLAQRRYVWNSGMFCFRFAQKPSSDALDLHNQRTMGGFPRAVWGSAAI
jgi:mannose-1-phosphate guanylyltransferase